MSRIYMQNMGISKKYGFHELEHGPNMRLLKTHSHASERRGYEAEKERQENGKMTYS